MKTEADKLINQVRGSIGEPSSDYRALRRGETACFFGIAFLFWATPTAVHSLQEIIGPQSLIPLVPYPIAISAFILIWRRLRRITIYCSYFEARIGTEPLKSEEMK